MATVYTQAGEEKITDLTTAASWYIAWGTGAGTAVKGSTTLNTEAPEARVLASTSQPSADISQFVATITASAGRTITNAGVFDASSGGNLLIHADFTGVVLLLGDKIEFTFTLEQT